MTVYVDELRDYGELVRGVARRYGTTWCHLMADTEDELRAFAEAIGCRANWIQHAGTRHAHFDLVPSRRAIAVQRGAVSTTTRELVRLRAAAR